MAQHEIDPDKLPYSLDKLPKKEDVGIDHFFALDLRVGRITEVEPFPEARKPSWKVTADFGPLVGELTTSAQITRYPENDLVGRLIVGAINLGEKRIAGFKSQFLILGTLDPDGTVRLLRPEVGAEPGQTIA